MEGRQQLPAPRPPRQFSPESLVESKELLTADVLQQKHLECQGTGRMYGGLLCFQCLLHPAKGTCSFPAHQSITQPTELIASFSPSQLARNSTNFPKGSNLGPEELVQ